MGKIIEGKNLAPWKLLPAKTGTCPECAVAHDPKAPHNAQSLFYQYKYFNEHDHWPNWKNAMAHCSEEIKSFWVAELQKMGVNVEAGEVNPSESAKNG